MIDRTTFVKEWELLHWRFGRALNLNNEVEQRGMTLYLDTLDKQLNTELFQEAARKIFNEDRFFPTPERFIEAALNIDEETLEKWWNTVYTTARKRGAPGLIEVPEHIREAMHGHNIYARLCQSTTDKQRENLRREFLTTCRANLREGGIVRAS